MRNRPRFPRNADTAASVDCMSGIFGLRADAGHPLKHQHIKDLADNVVRHLGPQDSARNIARLDQQQFRLSHRSLQSELAVSPVRIRSSIRTSRAVKASDFSDEPTEKFLPMDTSQSHAIVLGGHAK